MKLKINDEYEISDLQPGDRAALVEYFSEKQIADQLLSVPYPYKEADADWWVTSRLQMAKEKGQSVSWCIRRSLDGKLVGGIGFVGDFKVGDHHQGEIGYWICKPLWGKGIMPEAVRAATRYGFENLHFERIIATPFLTNLGSQKVLEKAGYQREGTLRSYHKKGNQLIDVALYAILKNDRME